MPHLKHKALWITIGAVSTALFIVGVVFLAFAQSVPPDSDYAGIALIITAIGTPLTVLISTVAAWKANNSDKQALATHTAVNSRMDEFKQLFEKTFKMEGAEEERISRRDREAVEAKVKLAVAMDAKLATAPTAPAADAASVLAAAELKARELLANATVDAAKVLAEAHKVSITNANENPVPVQVVGPGVDSPLKVIEAEKEKKK